MIFWTLCCTFVASLPSQSWLYSQTCASPQYTLPSSREVIQDEQSLSHYLKGYENFEKNSVISKYNDFEQFINDNL